MKIKNRNKYDIIYECLKYCKDNHSSLTAPNTKSRFYTIFGGNSTVGKNIFTNTLIKNNLIIVDPNIEHYADVYMITDKGLNYMKCYEGLQECLK